MDHQLHAPQPLARGRADLDHLQPRLHPRRPRRRPPTSSRPARSGWTCRTAASTRCSTCCSAAAPTACSPTPTTPRTPTPAARRATARRSTEDRVLIGHQWPPPPRRHPERPLPRARRRRGRRRGHGPQRRPTDTVASTPSRRVLRAGRCRLLGRLDPGHARGLARRGEEGRRARRPPRPTTPSRPPGTSRWGSCCRGSRSAAPRRRPVRHPGRRARPAHPRPPGRERQPRRRAQLGGLRRPHRAAVGRCRRRSIDDRDFVYARGDMCIADAVPTVAPGESITFDNARRAAGERDLAHDHRLQGPVQQVAPASPTRWPTGRHRSTPASSATPGRPRPAGSPGRRPPT